MAKSVPRPILRKVVGLQFCTTRTGQYLGTLPTRTENLSETNPPPKIVPAGVQAKEIHLSILSDFRAETILTCSKVCQDHRRPLWALFLKLFRSADEAGLLNDSLPSILRPAGRILCFKLYCTTRLNIMRVWMKTWNCLRLSMKMGAEREKDL